MERGFSERLHALRAEKGLSQRAVAADLHISQALLSHYENGAREPGLQFVCRACDYYGVTADYMLGRSQRPGAARCWTMPRPGPIFGARPCPSRASVAGRWSPSGACPWAGARHRRAR